MTLLEIGPGDCALSFEAAKSVRQVYAVDVDAVLSRNARPPANFRLFLSDGVSVPVPPGVDFACSNQLMEHLHPEDACQQLCNIFAASPPLVPGPHGTDPHPRGGAGPPACRTAPRHRGSLAAAAPAQRGTRRPPIKQFCLGRPQPTARAVEKQRLEPLSSARVVI
jgi:hypothetical protein